MINLRKMIVEYLLDSITEEDIKEAITCKLECIDIGDALADCDKLEDAIYRELSNAVNEAVDAWL